MTVERGEDGLLPAIHALYAGDRAQALALLPADEELNAVEAAFFGRLERLRALLEADPACADSFSPDGFAPLHASCFSGGVELTRLLLEHGADRELTARSSFARVPPLGTAAFSGDLASARALLEAGAAPDGAGGGGGTPLHTAA